MQVCNMVSILTPKLPCSSTRICAHCASALQGEDQKKLDVLANEVFINLLSKCGQCAVLVRH